MTVPPTTAQKCDADLIEGSLIDPEAFAALFDRYSAMLFRYVSRRLGPEAAEDVVGETFLAAFSRRHRYDLAQRDAHPWLFGIATRLVAQHHRTRRRVTAERLFAPFRDWRPRSASRGSRPGVVARGVPGWRPGVVARGCPGVAFGGLGLDE
ncbi:RNA polymerase sigma factor [Actinomadura sp. 9N215]|uniref:RNA polymerase sigma factor n=1 Tax=Actinomadura sp. 9N215 TaxID=3375150 RepID=UPI0037A3EF00